MVSKYFLGLVFEFFLRLNFAVSSIVLLIFCGFYDFFCYFLRLLSIFFLVFLLVFKFFFVAS